MRYNIDKKIGKDRLERQLLLSKYHQWLEKERQKDRDRYLEKAVSLANHYLAKKLCPHCKRRVEIVADDKIISKVCKRHGILSISRRRSLKNYYYKPEEGND